MKCLLLVVAVVAAAWASPQPPPNYEIPPYNPISVNIAPQPNVVRVNTQRPPLAITTAPRVTVPVPNPDIHNGRWVIIRQSTDIKPVENAYVWNYETENKISAEESGVLQNAGSQDEAMAVQGYYNYIAPDGTPISVEYTAGADGFQPRGDHIPGIPAAILRALEHNRQHPEEDDWEQFVRSGGKGGPRRP